MNTYNMPRPTADTNPETLKKIVKEKYAEIAGQTKQQNETGCCGSVLTSEQSGCGCATTDYVVMAENYSKISGYVADADLGLGCGLPTEFAQIEEGDTVIDLGSGAGNDAFIARAIAGVSGKVIGIDFTEKMIEKARLNAEKMGFNNVEFRYGDIENLPVSNQVADVIVSNCVLNLVPDKRKAFTETFRVLKPGGHFSVSDIVIRGELPDALRRSAEMYAGCVSGAISKKEYLQLIEDAGFTNVSIQKERRISIPDEIAKAFLDDEQLIQFKSGEVGIYSITVYGEKPGKRVVKTKNLKLEQKAACCGAESICC